MSIGRTIRDNILEVPMMVVLGGLIFCVIWGIYAPLEMRDWVAPAMIVLALLLALILVSMVVSNRLMARMGFRNLVRHRGDSAIAVIGFMIGTAIISSSLAVGDTMGNMVESFVYERYHLADEVVYSIDTNGNLTVVNSTQADRITDAVLSADESSGLIDGLSWEMELTGSMYNDATDLSDPFVFIRAFDPSTAGSFGGLYSSGEEIDYGMGPDEIAMTEEAAMEINAEAGHTIWIYTATSQRPMTLRYILDQRGRAASFGGMSIYASLETVWSLYHGNTDGINVSAGQESYEVYNILYVSNRGGVVSGGRLSDEAIPMIDSALESAGRGIPGTDFKVREDKKSGVDRALDSMDLFTKLFITIGSFSIIAGITLIINIFVMLSEERRNEMGISRAVGMKRTHLRTAYVVEGALYSLISSGLGVIVGLAAGYLIILFSQNIISSFGDGIEIDLLGFYRADPMTMFFSFTAGFAITLGTTYLVTRRITNLNVVAAIKDILPPRTPSILERMASSVLGAPSVGSGEDPFALKSIVYRFLQRTSLWGYMSIAGGLISLGIGIQQRLLWPSKIGISFIILGIALVASNIARSRPVWSAASIIILIIWSFDIPVISDFGYGIELFVLSGFFMVTAGVVLIVMNTDVLLLIMRFPLDVLGISQAPLKMAVSYPLKKKFRTGITIFMFAIIIFTVTGISMFVHIFNVNINEIERQIGGGYDIIGISTVQSIDDLESTIESNWGSYNATRIDWEGSSSIAIGYASLIIDEGGKAGIPEPYMIAGIPESFTVQSTYGFDEVDWQALRSMGIEGSSDREVWRGLSDQDMVIVDGTFGDVEFGPPGRGMSVGDSIEIVLQDGTSHNKTILAITASYAIQSLFFSESTAASEFGVQDKNLHMISVRGGEDALDISDGLEQSLLRYGFFTIVVEEFVKDILRIQNSFFDLFNAYLSLGLIIGIVGLGIVTLRSVYERRHEIGMMRAIGFKKRAVVTAFLGEASFIAGSGLVLGSIMGIVLGWILWRDQIAADYPRFGIPWIRILVIISAAFLFALMSCIPPANRASGVTPAEALRYE
ncbi:MAG: ABC transporter permease [Thermoplasmatota archaeon]